MSKKRTATTDLNHTNWNQEEEVEERGTFRVACEDEIQNRVIKKAKRKLATSSSGDNGSSLKSAFTGFSGFSQSTVSAGSSSSFAFLPKVISTASSSTIEGANDVTQVESNESQSKSSNYYAKVKALNQSVTEWIKSHVDKSPLCILTPIFEDYEKYLNKIQAEEPNEEIESNSSNGGLSKKSRSSINEGDSLPKANTLSDPTKTNFVFPFEKPNIDITPKPAASMSTFSFASTTVQKTTAENKLEFSSTPNLFSQKSSDAKAVSSTTGSGFSAAKQFSFGFNNQPFTFASNVSSSDITQSKNNEEKSNEVNDEDEEPPKNEFKQVVEADSKFSKKCKVFIKIGTDYRDHGVGILYLKPVENTKKTQLLVRAENSLGNVLLNIILSEAIPTKRMGKNNVMLVCIPTPNAEQKPTSVLLRVKTSEEADELLNVIDKNK